MLSGRIPHPLGVGLASEYRTKIPYISRIPRSRLRGASIKKIMRGLAHFTRL